MTVATWLAILVLGPGSLVIFALFLRDVGKVLNGKPDPPEPGRDGRRRTDRPGG